MLSLSEAKNVVIKNLGSEVTIASAIEHDGLYLFIAYRDDPLEGRLDPFFSVHPKTGYFRDFSPSDYSEPLTIINALNAALERSDHD